MAHNTNQTTPTDASSFEGLGLSPAVMEAVADLGYRVPSPVQAQAIPYVLAGRDVMAAAQTGTGKTAAFLLPALDHLAHARHGQGPLMLVVTPTRELASQIEDTARTICARTHHSCTVVVGGVSYGPQREALRRGCDLLVATPGRLLDLMSTGDANLSQVAVLVLDEADRMLDMGFLPAMKKIVAKTPDKRQTLLFSATLGPDVLKHTNSLVRDPARVEIAPKGTAAETVDQFQLGVDPRAKVSVLTQILEREGSSRVIVFCRGKHRCDAICRKLRRAGISCAPIHGNRTQAQRTSALRRFAEGEVDVLVATDVLARGIDIAEVSYVVNLDVPSDAEDYIHRIGRTGRAGEYGWALTFVSEDEYLNLRDIEQLMGKIIPPYPSAAQIERGEEPFEPDPARNPADKLPGKRMRKKLQAQRVTQEHAGRESRESAGRKSHGSAVRTTHSGGGTQQVMRAGAGNRTSRANGARTARAAGGNQQAPRTRPDRTGSRTQPSRADTRSRPSRTQSTQRPRRHPGDHGGAARRG